MTKKNKLHVLFGEKKIKRKTTYGKKNSGIDRKTGVGRP